MTTQEFITRARKIYGNNYDYSATDLDHRIDGKVIVTCRIHGDFTVNPSQFVRADPHKRVRCPKCNPSFKSNTEAFIMKARQKHGDTYDYSLVEYKNSTTPVKIICPKHGIFSQEPNDHLSGNGCPRCYQSKLERNVRLRLIEENIDFEEQKKFDGLKMKKKLSFDFYIPDRRIAIECQGEQHFKPVALFGGQEGYESNKRRDEMKRRSYYFIG